MYIFDIMGRRAVKAVAILIPLFGLQAAVVAIRTDAESQYFEVFRKIVDNTQVKNQHPKFHDKT